MSESSKRLHLQLPKPIEIKLSTTGQGMEEPITVYDVEFPHPDYTGLVAEDIQTVVRIIENELEYIEDADDQIITFTVRRRKMSAAEFKALPEAD